MILVALVVAGCGGGQSSPASPVKAPAPPAPIVVPDYVLTPGSGTLIVLMAMTKDDATLGPMGTVPSSLLSAGYPLLALDLPCHGADADPALPPLKQLTCWRNRIEAGDRQIFTRYCDGLSAVFDKLNAVKVFVVGQSRGGYLAATCAARDARIRKVVMIAPVTDLQRLTEFDGYTVNQTLFGLAQYTPALQSIQIRVRIGNDDQRVGTDAAVAFAKAVGATLDLVDLPGHVPPEDGSTVRWLSAP